MDPPIDQTLIKKELLYPGSKYIPLTSGTRVIINFCSQANFIDFNLIAVCLINQHR